MTTPGWTPAPAPAAPPPRRRGPTWGGVIVIALACSLISGLIAFSAARSSLAPAAAGGQPLPAASSTIGALPTGTPALPSGSLESPDWPAVAAAVEPATASLQVSSQAGTATGSGIVLDAQGNVLTNHHVAAGMGPQAQILVTLSDGLSYPATLVGSDVETDIAVVRIQNPPAGLQGAAIGDSDQLVVGQPVMAIGAPLGLKNTVTTGIVSALHRPVVTQQEAQALPWDPSSRQEAQFSATSAIQTDASINPGNSGGALVDGQGRVIGVNSSIASNASDGQTAGSIGLGFAIPINTATAIAEQLLATGSAVHPVLGITVQSARVQLGDVLAGGAAITGVEDGSAAAKAGLRTGDVILAVDGVTTGSSTAVIAFVRSLRVGTQHTLTVVRDGGQVQVPITLEKGA